MSSLREYLMLLKRTVVVVIEHDATKDTTRYCMYACMYYNTGT